MRNGKSGNKEMGKLEEGTLHCTQQTADILLLQSSNVMGKSMSNHALTERSSSPDSWHQKSMQRHCIKVCKLILCISSSLLAKFVESVKTACTIATQTIIEVHKMFV